MSKEESEKKKESWGLEDEPELKEDEPEIKEDKKEEVKEVKEVKKAEAWGLDVEDVD